MREYDHIIGEWFYDQQQDESFLVVDVIQIGDTDLFEAAQMYADGIVWDENAAALAAAYEENVEGLNGDGYVPLGRAPPPFPSFQSASDLCETGHKFPVAADDMFHERPFGTMFGPGQFVRCARCALSYATLAEYGLDHHEKDEWDGERGAAKEYWDEYHAAMEEEAEATDE